MSSDIAMITLWRPEINLLKERVKALPPSQKVTAFYGSSSIRLWDEMVTDLAPHPVVNLGFGGSSYRWCDHFFEEVFEGLNPKEIVLYAGDNDLGNDVPEAEIMDSVQSILRKIEGSYGSLPVSIISVKPSPDRLYLKENIERLNAALRKLLTSQPHGTFIDIHPAMLYEGKVRPELYLEDQLHMNRGGYEIWQKVIKMHLDSKSSSNGHH